MLMMVVVVLLRLMTCLGGNSIVDASEPPVVLGASTPIRPVQLATAECSFVRSAQSPVPLTVSLSLSLSLCDRLSCLHPSRLTATIRLYLSIYLIITHGPTLHSCRKSGDVISLDSRQLL